MKAKLYVSNLPNDTDEAELEHHFSRAGKVASVAIVRGRYSNASRGIAMLEMETEEDTQMALKQLNGALIGDHSIGVSRSKRNWTLKKG